MRLNARHVFSLLLVLICGLAGWWLTRDLSRAITGVKPAPLSKSPPRRERSAKSPPVTSFSIDEPPHQFQDGTTVEMFSSCRPDEVILRFPSNQTYGAFLSVLAASKVRLLGRLDRLQAMRLSYDDILDLDLLLSGENISTYRSLPSMPEPTPPARAAQNHLLGFGNQALNWLGVPAHHSRWGAGVKIAVIDSGVVSHPALPKTFRSVATLPFPEDPGTTNFHGTAVASLIFGLDPGAPGISPAAELISIRVIDEQKKTDAFAVAAGLLAAIDEGAQLINLSLGTTEDNPLVRESVRLAQESGAVIVASSGNFGQERAAYPANYPGVISVGAVDARGTQLDFSNFGDNLSLTAPGLSVSVAVPGGTFSRATGTSASAPLVTGAIAAVMSNESGIAIGAAKAAEIVMTYCDEAGIPGPDSQYGSGILNVGRIMNRNRPGMVDAAITHQQIVRSANGRTYEIQVGVQNRGTANLVNILLELSTPAGSRRINITSLAPCAIQTLSAPIDLTPFPPGSGIPIRSTLDLGTNGSDVIPANNQRTDSLIPQR